MKRYTKPGRRWNLVTGAASVWLCLFGAAWPAPGMSIIGQFDWNASNDLEGWTSGQTWVSLSNPNAGGIGDSGYLRVTLAPTAPAPSEEWTALVTVNASSLFAGSWDRNMGVGFQFLAEDVAPGGLQVRWQGDSGTIWRYALTPPAVADVWTGMDAPFREWQDWAVPGATMDTYINDLASIDWIGIYLFRNTPAGQSFGLDDFQLRIPEPEEYCLLTAAAVVVLMVLRRKRAAKPA